MKLCPMLIVCSFFLLFIYFKSWTYLDDPTDRPAWKNFDIILLIIGVCLVVSAIVTGRLNI